jgi:tRNA A-37 threonylcarbamoyl transferase component Bud32
MESSTLSTATTRRRRDPLIDTTLNGRYRIEAEIGSGGMSTVYLAFDQTLERRVAVKILHSEVSRDESALERFRREARTVARLSHPHIVMVIDAGEDRGRPYIVFEYVKGETLKNRINRRGRLPISEAVAYAIEVGRALETAHEHQLVHRDVKPQNVLLDEEGRAKVTDFGIARSLEIGTQQLTGAGRVVGTTDYVSPEQALGHEVTGQSDIYSLGIMLYEMLTGEAPFKADSSLEVATMHVREGMPDVQRKRPEVSAALAAVIEHATSKELANRYPSVGQMVRDLEEVLGYEAARTGETEGEATVVLRQLPGAVGRSWWRRRLPRIAVSALGIVALAVIAGVVIETMGGDGGQPAVSGDLAQIRLGATDADDYDPAPGDGQENGEAVRLALDGDPSTAWETERYDSPELGNIKDGVGLYLDAGRPVVARAIRIVTPKEGWVVQLNVANDVPQTVADWTRVGGADMDSARKTLGLDTGGQRFRYYLLWITRLAESDSGRFTAAISELRLLG